MVLSPPGCDNLSQQTLATNKAWELASLRPAAAHCRPGVKYHLSFSPPEASSWYFIFLFRGGWRKVDGEMDLKELSVLIFA